MKTALITGANRSIGYETTRLLAKKGVYVYVGCRKIAEGEEAVAKLKSEGIENVKALVIDVTNNDTIEAARNQVEKEKGQLDILINNAGINGGAQKPSDVSIETVQKVFETNFFGVIRVTQAFLGLLKRSDSPRISNITSGLASLTLHNDPNWVYYGFKGAAYGPSKTALNAYTIALAYELRELPFKVNAIDPGYTATDFNHFRGTGTIESAAAFIVKHTLTDNDAPTGKFFSNEIKEGSEESPW